MPNYDPDHVLFLRIVLRTRNDLALYVGDLGKSEKRFETKSPLSGLRIQFCSQRKNDFPLNSRRDRNAGIYSIKIYNNWCNS